MPTLLAIGMVVINCAHLFGDLGGGANDARRDNE